MEYALHGWHRELEYAAPRGNSMVERKIIASVLIDTLPKFQCGGPFYGRSAPQSAPFLSASRPRSRRVQVLSLDLSGTPECRRRCGHVNCERKVRCLQASLDCS